MAVDDMTVYGKRIGSLWDRRIGGRYELTAITDLAGTGMQVTLQRVDGGQLLTVSVYNLGRNYVAVPDVGLDHYDEGGLLSGEPRVIIPDEDEPAVPELVEPSDVPLAAWEIEHLNRERPIEQFDGVDFGDLIRIGGAALYRVVDADGKAILEPEPAPTPPLPWVEHPDAWWVYVPNGERMSATVHSSAMIAPTPADWHRAAVIPWGLIDQLRVVVPGDDDNGLNEAADAILDAADEVTS